MRKIAILRPWSLSLPWGLACLMLGHRIPMREARKRPNLRSLQDAPNLRPQPAIVSLARPEHPRPRRSGTQSTLDMPGLLKPLGTLASNGFRLFTYPNLRRPAFETSAPRKRRGHEHQ
jgi:hypothetical protein